MQLSITHANVGMINIPLDQSFRLGFGTLHTLPRVHLVLVAETDSGQVTGVGESAIDFPFVHYDAWDIFSALSSITAHEVQLEVPWTSPVFFNDEIRHFPSAVAAYNMALDDIIGKIRRLPIYCVHGWTRDSGQALMSLPYMNSRSELEQAVNEACESGLVPKPKVGQGPKLDAETILLLDRMEKVEKAVFDFNATLNLEEFEELVAKCSSARSNLEGMILEQPTSKKLGINGLQRAVEILRESGLEAEIAADESIVSSEDGVALAKSGIILNLKIQKVGGFYAARSIEHAVQRATGNLPNSFVGGTFPTAIGRAYDQHCAASLPSANLPGDGWLPSTNWFEGPKHLIREAFKEGNDGEYSPFDQPGLGITIEWAKIKPFIVYDPESAYRKLRLGQKSPIVIELSGNKSYAEVYEEENPGLSATWNL